MFISLVTIGRLTRCGFPEIVLGFRRYIETGAKTFGVVACKPEMSAHVHHGELASDRLITAALCDFCNYM